MYSKEWSFPYFSFRSHVHLLQNPVHHPFKFINQLQHMWAKLSKEDGFSALSVIKGLCIRVIYPKQSRQLLILHSAFFSSPDTVISVSSNMWENKLTSSVFHPPHTVLPYQLFLLLWDKADHNGFNAFISLGVKWHKIPCLTMKWRSQVPKLHTFNSLFWSFFM